MLKNYFEGRNRIEKCIRSWNVSRSAVWKNRRVNPSLVIVCARLLIQYGAGNCKKGVTTSRATSGDSKNDPNTSGQRWNNFLTSYIDRSFVVSGNNRVVKPKCKQFTSLNKMLSNSKVLIVHISFTALINNEGIGGIRKVPRRIKCTFCSCRKQSCCKAEMLPSYTSLLKKLSNFPQALTGTILLMLY